MFALSWRSPFTWFAFTLFSCVGMWFSIHYFDKASPMVNLNIAMDRNAAIRDSQMIAEDHHWFSKQPRASALFSTNSMLQYYIELEAGGSQAFTKLIEENIYAPYQWQVRLFNEQEITEAKILFKPDGTPFGFSYTIPENQPGAALNAEQARAIAFSELAHWPFDIKEFKAIEHAEKKMPQGRIDHTFVYELRDKKVGESPYRLQMKVQGDQTTHIELSIKTPESFNRSYMSMRSKNDTIARIAFMFVYLLYVIGGVLGGLIYLMYRRKKLLWRPAFIWASIIAILSFAALLNQIPLLWMNYQTATSASAFLGAFILDCLQNLFYNLSVTTLIIATTEGLTTIAFPNHIHLWHNWYKHVRVSRPIIGQTIGAYLLLGYKFAYVIAFYLLALKYLGWWTPSETLADPNILASYFAWLKPIANALYAGFIEECLFRAIPLSCAIIIGRWLGRERLLLGIAFIGQAIIFSAAHANYASQPAYSRVLELILPSFMYGGVFLLFGLLPAIITHVVYDVLLMAIPIWVNHAPGSIIDKAIIIIFASIPLLVIAAQYLRDKVIHPLDEHYYNKNMNHTLQDTRKHIELSPLERIYSAHSPYLILAIAALALAAWAHFTPFRADILPITISREQAIEKARDYNPLLKNSAQWQATARSSDTSEPILADEKLKEQHFYAWQKGGKEQYRALLGSYLHPLQWLVRFTKKEGSLAEKAEEYIFFISHDGTITRAYHQQAENAAAPTRTKEQAEKLLSNAIQHEEYSFKEISASNSKKPHRNEWEIIYKADAPDKIEKRISATVSGNEITDLNHYIHLPEDWLRTYLNEKALKKIFETSSTLLALLLSALLALYLFYRIRQSFAVVPASAIFIFFIVRMLMMFLLQYPTLISMLKTAEPISHQLFSIFSSSVIKTIFKGLIYGSIIGLFYRIPLRSPQLYQTLKSKLIVGGAAGIALGALQSLLYAYSPQLKPLWVDALLASSFLPSITLALYTITTFIEYTIIVLAFVACIDYFTNAWHQKRLLSVPIFVAFGLFITTITTLNAWIIGGIITGLALLIIYLELLRFSKESIPFAIAVYLGLRSIQYTSINPYPGAQMGALLTLITMLILGILSAQFLFKKRA